MTEGTALFGNPGGQTPGVRVDDHRIDVRNIESAHEHIHDSESFTATYSNAVTDINAKTALQWYYGGTSNKQMHVTFEVEALYNTTVSLYRSPATLVGSNSGTVYPVSRNQIVLGTPGVMTYAATPVVGISSYNEGSATAGTVTGGTTLDSFVLSGGEGPKALGAQRRDASEWLFGGTVATLYSLVMNAETASDDVHYIRMDWYEQDSGY